MKHILFLATAFMLGLSTMAQEKITDMVKVNTEKHDFGKLKQGVPVSTEFVLTNTTNKPLVIENAWGSCGCTTPEVPKEPIAAGGSTKLKVNYNAAALNHFDKDVMIKFAGIEEPRIVKITGEVLNDADYSVYKKATPPAAKAKTKAGSK